MSDWPGLETRGVSVHWPWCADRQCAGCIPQEVLDVLDNPTRQARVKARLRGLFGTGAAHEP